MRWILALIVMFALPPDASAENIPERGVSAPEVAAALKKTGYPADIVANRAGDPSIRSSTGKVLFIVHFHDCGAELRCSSIQFTSRFRRDPLLQARIAAWNRDERFGRAYQDKNGVSWIAMDVETSRGVTTEALEANIARWIIVLNAFESFIAV